MSAITAPAGAGRTSALTRKLGRAADLPPAAVYVIDAHAPRPATEALVAAIQARHHESHLLFVAGSFDRASAFGLLGLGAKGLLSYPEARGQLPRALRAVAEG